LTVLSAVNRYTAYMDSFVDLDHASTSFDTHCPVLHRPGCFRPSDRWAGWDSHPREIADVHGVPSFRNAVVRRHEHSVRILASSMTEVAALPFVGRFSVRL
jgi:hypothetical protein